MTAISLKQPCAPYPTAVELSLADAPEGDEIRGFIHEHFAAVYGADVRAFMPYFLHLRTNQGQLLAALGLRSARAHALFLEQYLDATVEAALADHLDAGKADGRGHTPPNIDRLRIVEVGNLAVGTPGGGRLLITALTAFLSAVNVEWAVFTCARPLQNAFTRLGIALIPIGEASITALPEAERAHWGRYYDQHPQVMVASVSQSQRALENEICRGLAFSDLWDTAFRTGQTVLARARAA